MFCGLSALAGEKDNIPVLFMRGLLTRHSSHIPVFSLLTFPPFLPNFFSIIHLVILDSSLSSPRSSRLTCEADIEDVIPVESAPVQRLHAVAQLGGVEAQTPLHVVKGMSHSVHCVHHKHDL